VAASSADVFLQKRFVLDVSTLLFFVVWTLISCPPNVLWQIYLEDEFPTHTVNEDGDKRLDKTNIAKKFLMDQSVSASVNTAGYIAAVAAFKGRNTAGIIDDIRRVCRR
jgi:protein Mpv17